MTTFPPTITERLMMNRTQLHHFRFLLFCTIAVLLLSGCAQLGLSQPQSFEDKLQYSKSGVSAAYKSIGDLKSSGQMTAAEGNPLFNEVEGVEKHIKDVETAVAAGDMNTANGKLAVALTSLTLLKAKLVAKGAPQSSLERK